MISRFIAAVITEWPLSPEDDRALVRMQLVALAGMVGFCLVLAVWP
jgi:hypothetical protein